MEYRVGTVPSRLARPGRSLTAAVVRYGGTPGPHAGPQLQGLGRVSEPVQCPVGGRDMERPHGLLAEHTVQDVREFRPQGHGPADPDLPRGGIPEGNPERCPEPGVGLRRQRDRRRHDPFGRGREMPVVRGGPSPGPGVTKPGPEDEQRPFDNERELGLGPTDGRFTTPCPAAGRQDQPMTAKAILVMRPLRPGEGSRRVRPLPQVMGQAKVARRSERRRSAREHQMGRSRLSAPQQAAQSIAGIPLRSALHLSLRRLPSVPDQS